MFGIDDALIWAPLAGAVIGGMTNRKDPLKGAMMGGALGYGGAAVPGLLGAAAPAAATPAATAGLLGVEGAATGAGSQAAMLAAQNEGFGAIGNQLLGQSAAVASGNAVPLGLDVAANAQRASEAIKPIAGAAKPVGDAAAAANAVNGLLTPKRPQMQAAPFVPSQGGAQSLAQLSNALQQNQLTEQQALAEQRARRMKLIGG